MNKINYELVTELGNKIIREKKEVKSCIKKNLNISQKNSDVIYYLIQYKKFLGYKSEREVQSLIIRLRDLVSEDRNVQTLVDRIAGNKNLEMFSKSNMIIMTTLQRSSFFINKFTSNLPTFFGYTVNEMMGMSIK